MWVFKYFFFNMQDSLSLRPAVQLLIVNNIIEEYESIGYAILTNNDTINRRWSGVTGETLNMYDPDNFDNGSKIRNISREWIVVI